MEVLHVLDVLDAKKCILHWFRPGNTQEEIRTMAMNKAWEQQVVIPMLISKGFEIIGMHMFYLDRAAAQGISRGIFASKDGKRYLIWYKVC